MLGQQCRHAVRYSTPHFAWFLARPAVARCLPCTMATASFSRSMDTYGSEGDKRSSPAAERNKQPILEVLQQHLPDSGLVLEVASGSGQHVAHFAAALPHLQFQPSDCTDELFPSIVAYTSGLQNVQPPVVLDCSSSSWPLSTPLDSLLCINMCHISPWAATVGLVEGAAKYVKPEGLLYIYGPFTLAGKHTSDSNAEFDASLKQRNSEWGYRDIDDVTALADKHGFVRLAVIPMPANNFSLVYRKQRTGS